MSRVDVSLALKRAIFEQNMPFDECEALLAEHGGARSVEDLPDWLAALAPSGDE